MRHKLNSRAFTGLEVLLLVVAAGLIAGTGFYVWHANQQTNSTYGQASKTAQTAPSKVTKKVAVTTTTPTSANYLVIKEWGVRAAYSGSLHLSYAITNNRAVFSSTELTAASPDCEGRGGWINRFGPGDSYSEGPGNGQTAADAYAQQTADATYPLVKVGNYYYAFAHDQAACGNDVTQTAAVQQQTNNDVKTLVSKLETLPAN